MNRSYPRRLDTHNLESLSERFFESSLPRNWKSQKISNDYGIDLKVDIFENNQATGLEFLVQLKASARTSKDEVERIRLKLSTYNHLVNKLQVVLIVKYIEYTNEAYWVLLRDIPQPEQSQKSFTVHISKTNTLSTISWSDFENHVRQVTRDKLTTREQIVQLKKDIQEYSCPFCGSMLSSRINAPANSMQDHWDDRETFLCGFQRFGSIIEIPCPSDPKFPRIENYEFEFIHFEDEPTFKWQCIAHGKTEMARKFNLGIGYGKTQNKAMKQLLDKYRRYASNKYI